MQFIATVVPSVGLLLSAHVLVMAWLVLLSLAVLAVAQETPLIGSSGYTEQQTLLNATEKQSVSDVIEVR